MTNIIKTLIATTTLVALSSTASAGDSSTTTFKYDASAPVEVTYARLQKTAEQACQIRLRDAGGIVVKTRIEKKCRAQLLSEAVRATKIRTLIAYHNQRIGHEVVESKFVSLGQDNSSN